MSEALAQDRPNVLSASTESYLDHRRRTRTTATKLGESDRKNIKNLSKPVGPCCKSTCRKAIPAGKTGKAGWQAQYSFATYGEGSTKKNVVLWFHTECCPVNDPLTDALALEIYLGQKCPHVTCELLPENAAEPEGDHTWLTHTQVEQNLLEACSRGGQFPTAEWLAFFKERRVVDAVAVKLVAHIGMSPLFSPGFQDDVVMGRFSPTHKALVSMLRRRLLTDPDAMAPCPHPDPALKGAIMCKDVTFNDALMAVCVFKAAKHDEAERQRHAAIVHRQNAAKAAVGA